jgi:hypothetical protein
MELRNHPGMIFHGIPNWPPVWLHAKADGEMRLAGEIGVLKYVHASNRLSNKCYLVMEHERTQYVGCLIFNDATFCYELARILRQYQGRPIKDIGDLNLAHLL